MLVAQALHQPYEGWCINFHKDLHAQISKISTHARYVVKVDQGIKGRYKKGLVILGVMQEDIEAELLKLHDRGYDTFIVEPQINHETADEKYIAFLFERNGVQVNFNHNGGVDIESNTQEMTMYILDDLTTRDALILESGFSLEQLDGLAAIFDQGFMTMLEINPYIVGGSGIKSLDVAIEVDDAGCYFTELWNEDDFRQVSSNKITDEERIVHELDKKSPASLKLEMINPNGSIFLLLSGGGASVVVADEVYNLGFGGQLANYGEYSGNPNTEETYLYTLSLLRLLIASDAPQKVLFIGGAVANFTDIAKTFTGVIRAIDETSDQLKDQHINVFVRRGGPRQEIGLEKIRKTLEKYNLLGAVYGPTTPITKVVAEAVRGLEL
jgi:succinyl-CoA synthetase beta subunit